MRETTWSKLRELWAIRRRCIEIRREQLPADSLPSARPNIERSVLPKPVIVCLAICFLAACLLHLNGMWQHGWLPYRSAPLPLNCFWTALVGLDLIAAILLLTKPRAGLIMSLLILSSDVVVNFLARFDLHLMQHHYGDALLFLQLPFLAIVSATAAYAMNRARSAGELQTAAVRRDRH